jgi:Tol biopolymer transport system component
MASVLVDGKIVFQCPKDALLLSWWREKEFACIESRSRKQVVIFHGKAGPGVDQIVYPDGPVVSPDGKQVAYRAEDDGKEFVVVGDQIVPFKSCSDPVFGAGDRNAYLGCGPQGSFLVVDGTPWPSFQEGSIPYFGPDGRLVAYSAGERGRRFFVVNGRKGPEFDNVNYKLEFAPQDPKYAYIAWHGNKALIVLGDTPGPEFAWVDEPVFSPDGTKVAYRASRQIKQFVVAAGEQGPVFDWVSTPVFSHDGRKVAYTAVDGRELWLKVLELP